MDILEPLNKSILIINPGSSSLKWAIFDNLKTLLYTKKGSCQLDQVDNFLDKIFKDNLYSCCVIRFVHGGSHFFKAMSIDEEVLNQLEQLSDLAILHNKKSNNLAKYILEKYKEIKVVGVFDTEFFHDLPSVAQQIPLPSRLLKKYALRRYGFHGFAHSALISAHHSILSESKNNQEDSKIITLHLGSGCSMAAIKNGKPIETSMGFSPNDGLLMRTRTGELDPGLLLWLQKAENWSVEQAERIINLDSGWEGMSAIKSDFSTLLSSKSEVAKNAVDLFSHRVRKTLGAYFALLGGLDTVLLSGGVAEHNIGFCILLLSELEHLGINIDLSILSANKNQLRVSGKGKLISKHESKVKCWLFFTEEEVEMLKSLIKENLLNYSGEK